MSKKSTVEYVCSECGATSIKWLGQCAQCQSWNTLVERPIAAAAPPVRNRYAGVAAPSACAPIHQIDARDFPRTATGLDEFDRALGGGVVDGAVVLLGGEPGVGKSTLLLQALAALHDQGVSALYVTGEESAAQVVLRARRLRLGASGVQVLAEVQLERILQTIREQRPGVVVIDSVQTLWSEALSSAPGSVSQIRECATQITRLAKSEAVTVFMAGHVTKDLDLAGPMGLEHMVDTVLMFEGEAHSNHRIIRARKNRFGPVNEIGVFAMTGTGLRGVSNPSALFLSGHAFAVAGSCVMCTVDGTRPLLVEIQCLTDRGGASPRRLALGLERDRLAMLLAVLSRHARVATADQDVYTNAVGGLRICEAAADLAVVMALYSSLKATPLPAGLVVFGEIGLAGEVRPSPRGQERLKEALKLGYTDALVPRANAPRQPIAGLNVLPVARVEDAIAAVNGLQSARACATLSHHVDQRAA